MVGSTDLANGKTTRSQNMHCAVAGARYRETDTAICTTEICTALFGSRILVEPLFETTPRSPERVEWDFGDFERFENRHERGTVAVSTG